MLGFTRENCKIFSFFSFLTFQLSTYRWLEDIVLNYIPPNNWGNIFYKWIPYCQINKIPHRNLHNSSYLYLLPFPRILPGLQTYRYPLQVAIGVCWPCLCLCICLRINHDGYLKVNRKWLIDYFSEMFYLLHILQTSKTFSMELYHC